MRLPPRFPGERRAAVVEDGFYVGVDLAALVEVAVRHDGVPLRRRIDPSMPPRAWAISVGGSIVDSRGLVDPSGWPLPAGAASRLTVARGRMGP